MNRNPRSVFTTPLYVVKLAELVEASWFAERFCIQGGIEGDQIRLQHYPFLLNYTKPSEEFMFSIARTHQSISATLWRSSMAQLSRSMYCDTSEYLSILTSPCTTKIGRIRAS